MSDIEFLELPTFLRKFEQRADGVMWLLGAGASRASDIKTAGDMIWDFKSRLYRSSKGVPASAVSDLGDQRIRDVLQSHFDSSGEYPALWAEDEYARFFEITYPDAQDRRRYIDGMIRGARPSFGHMAMAHLMKHDLIRIIWTTNFDRVVEDAVSTVMGTGSILTVGGLGEPAIIRSSYSQQQWPIYAKLHGDFQSETLKNTTTELATQDAAMRDVLLDSCRNQGLAITGYSGRDSSVMQVLRDAINGGVGFPNGLFWFVREQDSLYQGVRDLMIDAKNAGVDACFVKAESFDELFSDIVRYLPQTEGLAIELDDKRQLKPRKIDLSDRKAALPFIRTNALPIIEYPQTCRLIDCDIGGAREISEKLNEKSSNLLAARIRKGVLAFGDDGEIKRVFSALNIRSMATHGILDDRLKFESGERALLRDTLFRALSEHSGFELVRQGRSYYFRADKGKSKYDTAPLLKSAGRLNGSLSKGDVGWSEACQLRLDYRMGQLWLLLNPMVLIDINRDTPDDIAASAKDWQRERRVRRYNKLSNALLDGWVKAIFGPDKETVVLGIDGGTGIGARFELMPITGFSGLSS